MSDRWSRCRRLVGTVVALVSLVVLAGCQVSTAVRVQVAKGGTGAVTVSVRFDRAASAAVGGVTEQLRTSDLRAAGWAIDEGIGPDGSTVVTLTHGFGRLSELPTILGEVARAPGSGEPLFRLRVTQTTNDFRITSTATGDVDLRCGVACFGDAALARAYGSEVGVDAGAFEGRAGAAAAARAFPFSLTLGVPGRVTASDAPTGPTGLRWTPVLGRRIVVSASAGAFNGRRVAETSAAGGVTVAVLVVVIVVLAGGLRRRRARHPPRGAHRAG